ncbi:MAG: hypothetical protein LBK95_06805, partial [Bifidobacteriaceae bacterium]|nr:hypothetical protein [Bifidobacteriaceae bacterium]
MRLGLDQAAIRFIHEASNDQERGRLFQDCRDGRVAVLIGSTQKMGTGANIQTRAVALHHMDCPWRPADLEQREGRVLRQGNQNQQVEICSYVTEKTYDAVIWQHIVRKAEFADAMRVSDPAREMTTDPDGFVVSASLAQAIATGDPQVLRRAELTEEVSRLEALRSAHTTAKQALRQTIRVCQTELAGLERDRPLLEAAAASVSDGARLVYTPIASIPRPDPADAGRTLMAQLAPLAGSRLAASRTDAPSRLGTIGPLDVSVQRAGESLWLHVAGCRQLAAEVKITELPNHATATPQQCAGLATRLVNACRRAPARLERCLQQADQAKERLADASRQLDATGPFDHADRLDAARAELATINEALRTSGIGLEDGPEPDQRITPAESHGAVPDRASEPATLRRGDVIRALPHRWDRKGAPKGMLEVASADPLLLRPASRPDQEPSDPGWAGEWTVVSRLASALDQVETIAQRDGWSIPREYDRFVPGRAIAVAKTTDPAPRVREGELLAVAHRHTGQTEWADGDGGFTRPERVRLTLATAAGSEQITIRQRDVCKVAVRAPDPPKAADADRPADQAPARELVWESSDERRVPVGSWRPKHWGPLLSPDGDTIDPAGDVHVKTRPGPHLSESHFAALYPPGEARSVELRHTRPGDLVAGRDVDPKLRGISGPVRIVESDRYSSRGKISYQVPADPAGTVHTVKRDLTARTCLLARSYTELDEADLRLLLAPGARRTEMRLAGDLEPGTLLWCGAEPAAPEHAGRLVARHRPFSSYDSSSLELERL